ncbi:MAG TPA: FUSC family protein, partial [Stellaceae bacterium]|nr:FUSC family protein [Stellaceae bacterium]
AIVCQPHLGASLRKGWYRMIGTVVGAVAIVVLTALFPQDRTAFLVGLALWGAGCAFVATILRNFAAYAAALAGITAAIIASDQLGAVGGVDGQAFMLAVTRASEICIGIVCAGIILLATDLGGASRRLASLIASISAEITGRFIAILSAAGPDLAETQSARRELVRQVIALDPTIDEALGESSRLRYHSPVLQVAVNGLFAALAGWRTIATHLAELPTEQAREGADTVLPKLPPDLTAAPLRGEPSRWLADPISLCRLCEAAVRSLVALPARTPSLRLLADQVAEVLIGISQALNGLALLVDDPARAIPRRGVVRLRVPDWLPAFVNALRAVVIIGAVTLFWIVTAWPNGALAITFAAIGVILFAPRADQAYAVAIGFTLGSVLVTAIVATVKFAILPNVQTFAGFSLVIGCVLVPAGALLALAWQPAVFTGVITAFVPLLAPANPMSYDTQEFYNSAMSIIVGIGAAALSFRVFPGLSPALRTRRLMALSLRDLRRLATGSIPRTPDDWQDKIYGRLAVLPEAAEPVQRSQLVAALSVGTQIIQLRHIARRLGVDAELDGPLASLARGRSAIATARFAQLDRRFASLAGAETAARVALRARGSILAISEALTQHAAYFDAGASG